MLRLTSIRTGGSGLCPKVNVKCLSYASRLDNENPVKSPAYEAEPHDNEVFILSANLYE